jgi:hypothetical protein
MCVGLSGSACDHSALGAHRVLRIGQVRLDRGSCRGVALGDRMGPARRLALGAVAQDSLFSRWTRPARSAPDFASGGEIIDEAAARIPPNRRGRTGAPSRPAPRLPGGTISRCPTRCRLAATDTIAQRDYPGDLSGPAGRLARRGNRLRLGRTGQHQFPRRCAWPGHGPRHRAADGGPDRWGHGHPPGLDGDGHPQPPAVSVPHGECADPGSLLFPVHDHRGTGSHQGAIGAGLAMLRLQPPTGLSGTFTLGLHSSPSPTQTHWHGLFGAVR